jgi:hypothetical protein
VIATGLKLERCPRRHSDETPVRVEFVEQREEIEFVGTASVEQHQPACRLTASRPRLVDE